jgi:ribosomal protein L1
LDAALSNSTLTGGGAYFESLSKEAETQLSREYDKIGMMAADNQLIEQRRKDVAEISNGLNKLGDESDLATLQYIARIQAEQLHLTVDMMDAQNRAKSLVELPSTKEAQMKALVIERQIKELQRAKAAESKPSYTPFTNGF